MPGGGERQAAREPQRGSLLGGHPRLGRVGGGGRLSVPGTRPAERAVGLSSTPETELGRVGTASHPEVQVAGRSGISVLAADLQPRASACLQHTWVAELP